ncbi:MAG TPA: DUF3467 domain-containing protein [Myxococcales bacterium]|nr:DUF3467 domain-containing protein [Myxococcales bacterium]
MKDGGHFFFGDTQVSATSTELRVDLLSDNADGSSSAVRLFVAPEFGRQAVQVLEQNLRQYEGRFGHIRVARPGDAPEAPRRIRDSVETCVNMFVVTHTDSLFFFDFQLLLARSRLRRAEVLSRVRAVTMPGHVPHLHARLRDALGRFPKP